MARNGKPTRFQRIRDITLFLVGLAGLIDQAFFVRPLQALPMAIFAAMVGYPGALSTLSVNVFLPGGEKEPRL